MTQPDDLIVSLYAAVADADWKSSRERGLELVRLYCGASAAATLNLSAGGAGSFTESVHSGFSRAELAKQRCEAPPGARGTVKTLDGGRAMLACYQHVHGGLVSVMALRWAPGARMPEPAQVLLALTHLSESSSIAQRLFVQRDEWLMSMGRSNRGAAALVDSRGFVHAGTERFHAMVSALGAKPDRVPFELPDVGMDERTSVVRGQLHVRVERTEDLLLVHLRQPLPLDVLSAREQEIARALGAGKTFKSVAKQCDIAVSTVANHATRIYRKLGIYRREELVELIRSPGLGRTGK